MADKMNYTTAITKSQVLATGSHFRKGSHDMAAVFDEDVPMGEPGPSSKRRRRLAEHGESRQTWPNEASLLGGSESQQIRRDILRAVESFKTELDEIVVGDVEVMLQEVARVHKKHQEALASSSQSTNEILDGMRVCTTDFIAKHAATIGQRIYNDLDSFKRTSPVRQSLLDMGQAVVWRELVCVAANLRVNEQAILLGQGEGAGDDESDGKRALYMNVATVPFDHAVLPQCIDWIDHDLMPLLTVWAPSRLDVLRDQLEYQAYTALGRLRAQQLFDIVSDFPDSSNALQDLVDCIGVVASLKKYVSTELGRALRTRLLHPGASTQDIIQFYTHLIRALRIVDPSDVILSHVVGPVRTYLRARADTVPVIVASLLGEAGEFTLLRDLMRESTRAPGLSNGIGKNVGDYSLALYDEGEDSAEVIDIAALDQSKRYVLIPSPDTDYAPRPIDAGPDYRQSRKADVVAIVASIFEDEEGFIAALERSCADQFLRVQRYDTSKEYETNENLKKRFGDAWLSRCDVMLNDIKKSQRYDRSIHRTLQSSSDEKDEEGKGEPPCDILHPLILSRQFWPSLKNEDGQAGGAFAASARGPGSAAGTPAAMFAQPVPRRSRIRQKGGAFQRSTTAAANASANASMAAAATATEMETADMTMPGQLGAALERYGKEFTKLVSGRRIRWLPGRGDVHVRLTMNDGRIIDERVLPIQAAVIELAAASRAPSKEVAEETGAPGEEAFTTSEVAAKLGIEARHVREALTFWIGRGVLRETTPGTFTVVETLHDR